jgi:2-oxoglutarate dehydrogenase E2 component (dihydrolipoamide succinyltransferase)
MPQMGESITEGTITKWLKKVGDTVERDEPLFEISTDKVDAEIPSPAAGTLTEIKFPEGATVGINTIVAVIGGNGKPATAPAPAAPAPTAPAPAAPAPAAVAPAAAATPAASVASGERPHSSPLVRKIAKDNNIDLNRVPGTGPSGRITKTDILGYIANPAAKPAPAAAPANASAAASAADLPIPGSLVPMTKMRSIIARRMVESKRTSPHVHTVFKVDMTRIVRLRELEKSKYEQRNGVKLTYMPFIARAAIAALRKHPIVNATVEGDAIRYSRNINIGIAVALEWGLIVPVIKQAEEQNFLGIARSIADLAERARQEAFTRRGPGGHLHADQLGNLRRAVRHAHHQPAAGGHPRHRRTQQGASGGHRRGRQRLHRHPLDAALLPGLRPPHRGRRGRRPLHG